MKNKLKEVKSFQPEEFVKQATNILRDIIEELFKDSLQVTVALSGGNTPLPIYKKLATHNLNWEKIKFFIVDERCMPNESNQSNYRNIKRCLFNHVPAQSFPVVKKGISYQQAALHYEKRIKKNVKIVKGLPQFDLIILGMGLDGHTASLFPETSALDEKKKLVVLNNIPQLNTNRITMTYPLILNAKKIILIAKGGAKKKILDDIFKKKYPISRIIPQIYTILN